jgi:hypothetical protein
MKIALVEWHDTHGGAGNWKDIADSYQPFRVFTVGYLTEFPEGVIVLPSYAPEQTSSDAQGFGEVHIPRGCIISITNLGRDLE